MKVVQSFRIDEEIIDDLLARGLNLSEIVRAALAKAANDERCPYCGEKMKKAKVQKKAGR